MSDADRWSWPLNRARHALAREVWNRHDTFRDPLREAEVYALVAIAQALETLVLAQHPDADLGDRLFELDPDRP